MKNCPNCGAPLSDTDTFCGNCGMKTEASQTVTFEDPIRGFNPDKIQETVPLMRSNAQMQAAPQMMSQTATQTQYQEPQQQNATIMANAPIQNGNTLQAQNQNQPVQFQPGQYQAGQPVYQQVFYDQHPQAGLITAIKIFLVIACVFSTAGLFIPLCWRLPMTIVAFKKMDQRQPLGLAFKICTLLFVGFIPGILMLALNDDM